MLALAQIEQLDKAKVPINAEQCSFCYAIEEITPQSDHTSHRPY